MLEATVIGPSTGSDGTLKTIKTVSRKLLK